MEFGIRVSIAVEYDDEIGTRDNLSLDFAEFVTAASIAEAAVIAARKVPETVAEHLGRVNL